MIVGEDLSRKVGQLSPDLVASLVKGLSILKRSGNSFEASVDVSRGGPSACRVKDQIIVSLKIVQPFNSRTASAPVRDQKLFWIETTKLEKETRPTFHHD